MVKAAFQAMRASQDFLKQEKIADIKSWAPTGASKRGWLCFLVAATECKDCGNHIGAIAPLVPIVPDLVKDIHRQWQSYDGFTFAFVDYIEAGLTTLIDGDKLTQMF